MRRFLSSALLILASTTVAVFLAEGLVRVFAPHARDHVVPAGMFDMDPVLGWKLHAYSDVRHRTRDFDVRYKINSMGFRDRPRTTTNAEGKRRVLFFGDSQIFGWGVEAGQHMASLVEASDPSMEIWNMGVPGYGLDQEVLLYERAGASIAATDVIFYVSRATLGRMKRSHLFKKPKPKFVFDSGGTLRLLRVRQRSSVFTDFAYRTLSPFYLPYFLETQYKRLATNQTPSSRTPDEFTVINRQIVKLHTAVLMKARTLAVQRKHRMFVLATLPDSSMSELKAFCDRNGVFLVSSPWPVAPPSFVFGKYNLHWNPRGHELNAARLRVGLTTPRAVRDSGELPRASSP